MSIPWFIIIFRATYVDWVDENVAPRYKEPLSSGIICRMRTLPCKRLSPRSGVHLRTHVSRLVAEVSHIVDWIRTRMHFGSLKSVLLSLWGVRGKKIKEKITPISNLSFNPIQFDDLRMKIWTRKENCCCCWWCGSAVVLLSCCCCCCCYCCLWWGPGQVMLSNTLLYIINYIT